MMYNSVGVTVSNMREKKNMLNLHGRATSNLVRTEGSCLFAGIPFADSRVHLARADRQCHVT